MRRRVSEERLLHHLVATGLVTPAEVTALDAELGAAAGASEGRSEGARITALIRRGRVSPALVESLTQALSLQPEEPAVRSGPATLGNEAVDAHAATLAAPANQALPAAGLLTLPGDGSTPLATLDGGSDSPSAATGVVQVQPFPVPAWDRYEFIELLGRGGMGAVYKARDRRLGREVALKFIHGDNPAQIQRFMQEARAQARLDHPHICKVAELD